MSSGDAHASPWEVAKLAAGTSFADPKPKARSPAEFGDSQQEFGGIRGQGTGGMRGSLLIISGLRKRGSPKMRGGLFNE